MMLPIAFSSLNLPRIDYGDEAYLIVLSLARSLAGMMSRKWSE